MEGRAGTTTRCGKEKGPQGGKIMPEGKQNENGGDKSEKTYRLAKCNQTQREMLRNRAWEAGEGGGEGRKQVGKQNKQSSSKEVNSRTPPSEGWKTEQP